MPAAILPLEYALGSDGKPTPEELQIDGFLASLRQEHQLPMSHNNHSTGNLRHYLRNGGRVQVNGGDLQFRTHQQFMMECLTKPPWVSVEPSDADGSTLMDRCTLCRRRNGRGQRRGQPWCNDSHFQSAGHQQAVAA